MNQFFKEVAITTRAHCAAHGFCTAELYGTPPNAAEFEVHDLIEAGVPAEAAVPRVVRIYRRGFGGDTVKMHLLRLRIAKACRETRRQYRSYYHDEPFERLLKIEQRVNGGAK